MLKIELKRSHKTRSNLLGKEENGTLIHSNKFTRASKAVCFWVFMALTCTARAGDASSYQVLDSEAVAADERIESRIEQIIEAYGRGKFTEVNVTSHNKWVLLTGSVKSEQTKIELQNIVLREVKDDIRRLYNEVEIFSGFHSEAKFSPVTDILIQQILPGNLPWAKNSLRAVVYNRKVFLMGVVTKPYGEEIINLVADLRNVSLVVSTFEWREKIVSESSSQQRRPTVVDETTFNIDRLRITKLSQNSEICSEGQTHTLIVEGEIGPDSTFAMEKILAGLPKCKETSTGMIASHIEVRLNSFGGLVEHGYRLGRLFRKHGVRTLIEDKGICASSCALGFLGGQTRVLAPSAQIMLHAPYFITNDALYGRRINCNIGVAALDELLSFYIEMVGQENGNRLFDRTMSYCSQEDGWVLTGNPAAFLFGVATFEGQPK